MTNDNNNTDKDSLLVQACIEGDLTTLQSFLEDKNDNDDKVNWKKSFSWKDQEERSFHSPLLFIPIDYNQYNVVKLLLESKICQDIIQLKDDDDYTPLQWASHNGSVEMVQLLVEKGAYVDQEALDFAKEEGHSEIVQILREKVDYYSALKGDVDEIMIKASREGDIVMVQKLIADGYDFDKWKDADGTYQEYSPIYIAMKNGHIELIREFLQAGVEAELHSTHFNHDVLNENGSTTPAPPPAELTEEQIAEIVAQMKAEEEEEERQKANATAEEKTS